MQEMIIVKNLKIFFFLHLIFDRCYLLNRVYYIYKTYIQMKSVKIYVI